MVRRNPIPAPPVGQTSQFILPWAMRTFSPGTPVALDEHEWYVGRPLPNTVERVYVPSGTRGEVVDVGRFYPPDAAAETWITIRIHDARPYAAGNLDRVDLGILDELWKELERQKTDLISKPLYAHDYTWGRIKPLVDNWSAPAPMKRQQLPSSQKRTSYKLRPNKIPHPLHRGHAGFREWVDRTYEAGTPARVKLPSPGWYADNGERTMIPSGHVVEVIENGHGGTVTVEGWSQVPWDGRSRRFRAVFHPEEAYVRLEPLADNWGAEIPSRWSHSDDLRATLPRSLRSNKRTSRRRTSRKKGRMRA